MRCAGASAWRAASSADSRPDLCARNSRASSGLFIQGRGLFGRGVRLQRARHMDNLPALHERHPRNMFGGSPMSLVGQTEKNSLWQMFSALLLRADIALAVGMSVSCQEETHAQRQTAT